MHSAPAEPAARTVRIGDVTFAPDTGEVSRAGIDGESHCTRLPPKPSLLLRMLIERDGELLSIDEIRDALWPDVRVEFDQGMHHCVRQVRAALGDSASSPRYIETLPRRGYRLMVPTEPLDVEQATALPAGPQSSRMTSVVIVLVVLAFMICLAVIQYQLSAPTEAAQPVRLAILTFDPPANSSWTAAPDVATLLTARLGGNPALAVVGPSTTGRIRSRAAPLADAADQLDVDYLINARFADRDGRQQMLIELVRASDGAHIWVRWFDNVADPDAIAATIAEEVGPVLDPAE